MSPFTRSTHAMPVTRPGEQVHYQGEARLHQTAGMLTVTNTRIMLTHVTGIISSREFTILDIPLLAVRGTSTESRLGSTYLVLNAQGEGYSGVPRIAIRVAQPAVIERLILRLIEAKRSERHPVSASLTGAAPQVNLHVHQVPAPTPPPKIMMRCPYCKTVYPELDAKCPSCGAQF